MTNTVIYRRSPHGSRQLEWDQPLLKPAASCKVCNLAGINVHLFFIVLLSRILIVLRVHLFALVFEIHNLSRNNKKKTLLGKYQCQTLNIGIDFKIL